ncbi:hypothetical protein ACJX0J_008344, partial [Zea mays]
TAKHKMTTVVDCVFLAHAKVKCLRKNTSENCGHTKLRILFTGGRQTWMHNNKGLAIRLDEGGLERFGYKSLGFGLRQSPMVLYMLKLAVKTILKYDTTT